MGKEKIVHIFEFLRHATINSGKTVMFSESELKAIKSYLFFTIRKKQIKKGIARKKKVKKSYHKKKKSKSEIREQRLKNLAKARKARKSKRS